MTKEPDKGPSTESHAVETPHPMPYSLRWALGAVVVRLLYMVSVLVFGLLGTMLAVPHSLCC
jgi:hypothetical protein